jgi:hypothetical protein
MPGERRFAERLKSLLEDDYFCWYDVPIGPRHQDPDFLILHPARGILVLEVKDWRLETIRDANPTSFTIDTGAGHKVVSCPLLTNPRGSQNERRLTLELAQGNGHCHR